MKNIIKFSIKTKTDICNVSSLETAQEYLSKKKIDYDKKALARFFETASPCSVLNTDTFIVKAYANISDILSSAPPV